MDGSGSPDGGAIMTTAVIFVPLSRPVPLLSFLGTISYSIYLLHQPLADRIINLYARFGASDQLQIAAVATSVAVSIVAATALWWLVERPSATFGRVFLKRTDDRSSMTRYAPDIK
jgi:peptidoglycan/LPS O-acetylase OafA/YrhL